MMQGHARVVIADWHGFKQPLPNEHPGAENGNFYLRISVALQTILRGAGVSGDMTLTGNEESLRYTSIAFRVRPTRHGEAPGVYYDCAGCFFCVDDWIGKLMRPIADNAAKAAVAPILVALRSLTYVLRHPKKKQKARKR